MKRNDSTPKPTPYVGDFISEVRRNKHITQEQLADYLNIEYSRLGKWERGVHKFPVDILPSVAQALKVDIIFTSDGKIKIGNGEISMAMLKKVVKDFENGKVLFYYQENGDIIEVIAIHKYGENDYSYWMVDIRTKDVNLEDIEESLHQLLYRDYEYSCEGHSSRSSLKHLVEETIDFVPTIKQDIRQLTSEMAIF